MNMREAANKAVEKIKSMSDVELAMKFVEHGYPINNIKPEISSQFPKDFMEMFDSIPDYQFTIDLIESGVPIEDIEVSYLKQLPEEFKMKYSKIADIIESEQDEECQLDEYHKDEKISFLVYSKFANQYVKFDPDDGYVYLYDYPSECIHYENLKDIPIVLRNIKAHWFSPFTNGLEDKNVDLQLEVYPVTIIIESNKLNIGD